MRDAISNEIEEFKKQFCISDDRRIELCRHFTIEVESFEELLPGKKIKSYAQGNRLINTSFIIIKVTDNKNDIVYYPVFSESLGRQLAKECNITLPTKMKIFTDQNSKKYGVNCLVIKNGTVKKGNANNLNLRKLIIFARSMMILHIDEPSPMNGVFKEIYDKLESYTNCDVFPREIYRINSAISSFINSIMNSNHENFRNLDDYINFIRNKYNKKIINYDFSNLKKILKEQYHDIDIYF